MNWIKPDWPVTENIHAATTLRTGGLSQGSFSSLNLAQHMSDEGENVIENRKIILQMLDLPSEPVWLKQVHGHRVINASNVTKAEEADASYTDEAGVVCGVLTADCLPVLLASNDGSKIAAIHAGWRGLLAGIIGHTVNLFGTIDCIVWLGPAIGIDRFEVGTEVRDLFLRKNTKFSIAFKQKEADKYLVDIYQLATIELASIGIFQVYGGGFCTVRDKDRFYSYRRDGETGRMATLIWRD
jgi:YfiH family protein